MTQGPLDIGFDEVRTEPTTGALSVVLAPCHADRPVWTYWFPLLCRLRPDTMRPASTAELGRPDVPFVYPVELRIEADEWCDEAPADQPLAVLPPAVERAVDAHRAVVVVSIAHEARPLFDATSARHVLLDRVADLSRRYGLPAHRLWFVSGNLDGAGDVAAWCRARGRTAPPFTFRAYEPFSAFVGACVRESLLRSRAPAAAIAMTRRGPHQIGWSATTVRWVDRPFPGLVGQAPGPPAFGYACLNRYFRPHRWHVLHRLWRAGVLDRGLVSFPELTAEDLGDAGIDPDTAAGLIARLPLTVDTRARFDDAAFFGDNTHFVGLHPEVVLRDCGMELVTETRQAGCRFVSEKAFKALLGRGPAVVVGARGVLAYLRSLGVPTWGARIDESYDDVADPGARLAAAVDSALAFVRSSGPGRDLPPQVRESNLRWLLDAPKPWDALVEELAAVVKGV